MVCQQPGPWFPHSGRLPTADARPWNRFPAGPGSSSWGETFAGGNLIAHSDPGADSSETRPAPDAQSRSVRDRFAGAGSSSQPTWGMIKNPDSVINITVYSGGERSFNSISIVEGT